MQCITDILGQIEYEALGIDADATDLDEVARVFPNKLLLPIGDLLDRLSRATPPHVFTDYMELANKACAIYCDCSGFFSIADEIFDSYDYDNFTRAIGAQSSEYLKDFYRQYMDEVTNFVKGIIDLLLTNDIPYFTDNRCVYLPESIDTASGTIILRLDLDNL